LLSALTLNLLNFLIFVAELNFVLVYLSVENIDLLLISVDSKGIFVDSAFILFNFLGKLKSNAPDLILILISQRLLISILLLKGLLQLNHPTILTIIIFGNFLFLKLHYVLLSFLEV